MFCTKCGAELVPGSRFCKQCGAPVAHQGAAEATQVLGGAAAAPAAPNSAYSANPTQQTPGFDPRFQQNAPVYGPPPAPAPKRSKVPIVVAIVIVVVVIALAAFFLFGRKSSSTEPAAQEPPATQQPAATPEPEPAPEPAPAPEPDPQAALDAAVSDAIAEGYQVVSGTVRIMSSSELADYQGIDSGMFNDGTFAVVILDHETTMDGQSGDGSGIRTGNVTMVGVAEYTEYDSFVVDMGDLDMWRPYDGRSVTIAVRAEALWFPSDVSLPVGEPRTEGARILG